MKLCMIDIGMLRLDLICCCKICDCLIFGNCDEIIDM